MRIQFSKNPFGRKRDVAGNLINTPVPGSLPAADMAPAAAAAAAAAAIEQAVGTLPGDGMGVGPPLPE